MPITVNILYTGKDTAALDFAHEMLSSGIVEQVQKEIGNLRYEYFVPIADNRSVLLIDEWENQAAIDEHHKSEMMKEIASLRNKYHLRMRVTRYTASESEEEKENTRTNF